MLFKFWNKTFLAFLISLNQVCLGLTLEPYLSLIESVVSGTVFPITSKPQILSVILFQIWFGICVSEYPSLINNHCACALSVLSFVFLFL